LTRPSTYRAAGVDIEAKYAAVEQSLAAIRSTFTQGVVGDVGSFGGLFDPRAVGAEGQLLVASTDGVGTKVKIATATGRFGGVGEDLVNHCVNDILVQGARPLFFLDYIALGRMAPEQVRAVIGGVCKACRENGCALLGGETAEMPGVYVEGELDVAGTIVGAVARDKLLDGSRVRVGDQVLALPSTGLHTNGYSLARHVVQQARLGWDDRPDELRGATVADALLAVHKSYYRALWPLLERDLIHALAHVTGGGLQDNLPRVLPNGTAARVHRDRMPRPPIFDLLVRAGRIEQDEAWHVLNMGFGIVFCVAPGDAEQAERLLRGNGEAVYVVGEIVGGSGEVILR
jgi:phosphoribosylformylglycinamidine cyclo-ligase